MQRPQRRARLKAGSMSKIDTLIADLCPDGVEYRHLYDVTHFDRGQVITAKDAVAGIVPVVAGGQKPAYYHNVSNRPAGTITVAGSGAYAGYVSMWDTPIWLSDAFSVSPNDEHELSSDFLYQLLKLNQNWIYAKKKGSGVPHVHGADLSRLQIPVPPIEVQREIVRILDSFTELEAELEARKAQYAYYRDRLLSRENLEAMDGKPVETVKLGDLFETFTGKTPKKTDASMYGSEYPFYKPGDFEHGFTAFETEDMLSETGFAESKHVKPGSTLVTCIASLGKIGFAQKEGACNQQINVIPPTEDMNSRFVFHFCCSTWFQSVLWKKANHSNVPNLSLAVFNTIEIPIPSLATQQKVVDSLDRFDALTTSLTDGIPAEIEARKAQYGYYRDRLLDFPRKEAAAS